MRSLGIFEQTGHSEAKGRQAWSSCLLTNRCTLVGLGFKGLEMALQWGLVESNGDALGGYM